MHPFVGGYRGFGTDLNRIARPLMMQTNRDAAVLHKQLVAATACVCGSFAAMQNKLPFGIRSSLQPERDGKRIGAREVANPGKGETVFAI